MTAFEIYAFAGPIGLTALCALGAWWFTKYM